MLPKGHDASWWTVVVFPGSTQLYTRTYIYIHIYIYITYIYIYKHECTEHWSMPHSEGVRSESWNEMPGQQLEVWSILHRNQWKSPAEIHGYPSFYVGSACRERLVLALGEGQCWRLLVSCWQGPETGGWGAIHHNGRFEVVDSRKILGGTTSFPFLDGFSMKFSLIIKHPLYKPSSYKTIITIHYINHPATGHFPITKPNPHFYAVETHTFPVIPMPLLRMGGCWHEPPSAAADFGLWGGDFLGRRRDLGY